MGVVLGVRVKNNGVCLTRNLTFRFFFGYEILPNLLCSRAQFGAQAVALTTQQLACRNTHENVVNLVATPKQQKKNEKADVLGV